MVNSVLELRSRTFEDSFEYITERTFDEQIEHCGQQYVVYQVNHYVL